MRRDDFESLYRRLAPWDIPRPQLAFQRLEESGAIIGSVLDAGCGTGENALYLAARGHEVWGIDFVPVAIEQAKAKAAARALIAQFLVADALELDLLGRLFDTVIDSGLFHTFDDHQRVRFVDGLARVVPVGGRVHILCFSEFEPPGEGPRRVTRREIRNSFLVGWHIDEIRSELFEYVASPDGPKFTSGGAKAWIAMITRVASPHAVFPIR